MGLLFDLADLIEDAADGFSGSSLRRHTRSLAAGAGLAAAAGLAGAMIAKSQSQNQPNPTPAAMPQNLPPLPVINQAPPTAPTFSFYAIIEGEQHGPYNEVQFKRLVDNDLANAETQVWQEGMTQWMPAGQVEMMAKLFPNQQQQEAAPAPQVPQMPQMPQQKAYYVNVNNQMAGPFTSQQLQIFAQTGEFTQQMYVWCDGMPEWLTAGQVPELAQLFTNVAPPMPTV